MKNKRGDISPIVWVIGAIVIMLILLVGGLRLYTGSFDFLKQVAPGSSGNNLGILTTQCASACGTQSIYDWCTTNRVVTGVKTSDNKEINGTCNELAKVTDPNLGIDPCPTITCP